MTFLTPNLMLMCLLKHVLGCMACLAEYWNGKHKAPSRWPVRRQTRCRYFHSQSSVLDRTGSDIPSPIPTHSIQVNKKERSTPEPLPNLPNSSQFGP